MLIPAGIDPQPGFSSPFGYRLNKLDIISSWSKRIFIRLLPENVVYTDNTLFIAVLRVADYGGTRLNPSKSSMSIKDSVVRCHNLSFVHH